MSELLANIHEFEELDAIVSSNDKVKEAFDLASNLEGNIRQLKVHACGIIIAPGAVSNYTPVQLAKRQIPSL